MWYQPIECDNTVKKPLVCDYSNFNDFGYEEDDFKSGNIISNWPEEIFFKASQEKYDGTPDDVLQNAYMFPIFSQRVKDNLEILGVRGLQYLPVSIYGFNGNIYEKFYIANITNLVKAFDYENSVYNTFSDSFPNPNVRGKIAGVKKFVLKSAEISSCDIFRLAEYSQRFFVSYRIQKLFHDRKFSGYSFIEISCKP